MTETTHAGPGDRGDSAEPLMDLVRRLYPICRSITGDGVRRTLAIVQEWLPLQIVEVPSGTRVFDWTVPKEWNIRSAWIADGSGRRVVDFRECNLHVLNYSVPVDLTVDRSTLEKHLHSLPERPDWIPYRTSYYHENWGFCIADSQRRLLGDGDFRVFIDSTLEDGSLTYGEAFFQGATEGEVLLYTHVCHPSLANDNLSGIAVAAALGRRLAARSARRYGYRLVFGPGTIGSLTWLSRNRERLGRIRHGLVLGLLGDPAPHTYKRSRTGNAEIDRIAEYVLTNRGRQNRVIDFSPWGYDERQFNSPGIALPVGRLTRSSNGEYPEYHTSADDLDLLSEDRLRESLELVCEIIDVLEANRYYVNREPFGEPQLGRRGLYRKTGGTELAERESAMLWLLNQCDGSHSVLDVALKSGIAFNKVASVADELVREELLQDSMH